MYYDFSSGKDMLADIGAGLSVYGDMMVLPAPVGVNGLLYGRNDEPSRFIVGTMGYDFGPKLPEGSVLEVVATLEDFDQRFVESSTEERLNMMKDSGKTIWYITDLLAKNDIDYSRIGLEQRLKYLRRIGDFRLYAFKVNTEDTQEFASLLDSVLRQRGVERSFVKGVNSVYGDGRYEIIGAVMADLRVHTDAGIRVGYPETYTSKYIPWKVIGVPKDEKDGAVIKVRLLGETKAEFIEETDLSEAMSKEAIRARMRNGGLVESTVTNSKYLENSIEVGI